MAGQGNDLASLLVGHMRGGLRKSAAMFAASGSALSPEEAARIRAEKDRQKFQRMERQRQLNNSDMFGYTTTSHYNSLPDVERLRAQMREHRDFSQYARSNPTIVPRKTMGEIAAETPKPDSLGDTWYGKALGYLHTPFKAGIDGIVSTGSYLIDGLPNGANPLTWYKDYFRSAGYGDYAHDVANNYQLQGNALNYGVSQLGRWAWHKLNPEAWGDSLKARSIRASQDNTRANASDQYHLEQAMIGTNFADPGLRMSEHGGDEMFSPAVANTVFNSASGQLTGDLLAGQGLAYGAKAFGWGIQHGLNRLGSAISASSGAAPVATAVADAAPHASRLGQAWSAVRSGLGNGVKEVGDLTSAPFRWAGSMAMPLRHPAAPAAAAAAPRSVGMWRRFGQWVRHPWTGGNANLASTPGFARARSAAVNGVRNYAMPTLRAWTAPARGLWRFAHHPAQTLRHWGANPWQTAGRLGRWSLAAGPAPAWRAVMQHPDLMRLATMRGAWGAVGEGKPGEALKDIGSWGLYGALGPVLGTGLMAYDVGKGIYNAVNPSQAYYDFDDQFR